MTITKRPPKFQKAFDSMTPAQRRVAIAKDVIAQVKIGGIVPTQGTYLFLPGKNKPVHKIKGACRCCGIGAVCVSAARVFDGISVDGNDTSEFAAESYLGNRKIRSVLIGFFQEKDIHDIESAFEDWELRKIGGTATSRLIAIMRNIIRNRGTFKPNEIFAPATAGVRGTAKAKKGALK